MARALIFQAIGAWHWGWKVDWGETADTKSRACIMHDKVGSITDATQELLTRLRDFRPEKMRLDHFRSRHPHTQREGLTAHVTQSASCKLNFVLCDNHLALVANLFSPRMRELWSGLFKSRAVHLRR